MISKGNILFTRTIASRLHKINRDPTLKLVLIKDHPTLGPKGSVVNVKRGHGRNVLVPQGIAVYASDENLAQHGKPIVIEKKITAVVESQDEHAMRLYMEDLQYRIRQLKIFKFISEDRDGKPVTGVTVARLVDRFRDEGYFYLDSENFTLKNALDEGGVASWKEFGVHVLHVNLSPDRPNPWCKFDVPVEVVPYQAKKKILAT